LTVDPGNEETREAPPASREAPGQTQATSLPTRVGELVGGKYRIERFLAQGGMGVVYEAQHVIVRRRFAVKFLRPDYAHRREFLTRFQREAEAAGALENEHIASAVDFGVAADGSPFMVMEYLVGENLAALLGREGRLPLARAADLCVQACHGAEAAHAAGILHRDLKPKNLFLTRREDGTDLLKILDFGVAKLSPRQYDHTTTDTGAVIGTPAYMSPEQARGERTLDARSDVYALGTILFEMLSGQLPHPGDSPNAILYHISTHPPISLAVATVGLPSAVVEAVDRALASDPAARPHSANALAQALLPFAQRQVWPERPGQEPADAGEPSVDPIRNRDALPHARRARRRWVAGLVAGVVLVAAALAVSYLARSPARAPDAAGVAQPTSRASTSPAPLPPTPAAPVPAPSPSVAPAAPTPAEEAPSPTVKPARSGRARVSGRPSGRPIGRPEAPSISPSSAGAPVSPVPQPAPAVPTAQPTRLRGAIDRVDPYGSP
jgi:eukaryotic-like serine/threonine-protein kinase